MDHTTGHEIPPRGERSGHVQSINALTLATSSMERSVRFYQALGLSVVFGGEDAPFTTFKVGDGYLNIQFDPDFNGVSHIWGRAVFWVDDVDTVYQDMVDAGYEPNAAPSDAPWGERYFPMRDPDGHDLSFARPLSRVENRDHVDHA